jgi:UDP-N-acetylmuramate--alanine ligase
VTLLDLTASTTVHLVGIGGAGMSGLARILLQRGHRVTGTDMKESGTLEELRALGADIRVGHDADAVGDVAAVVASSAVKDDNPELEVARTRHVPVLRRAELLAALMTNDRRVLVGGTHGKTTTTSMAVLALQAGGRDPSFAIGGSLNEAGTNAHAGDDALFVAEADESDRSLLVYEPDIAIVTNAELDHPDEFQSDDDIVDVFARFLANRRDGGTAIIGCDDPGSASLLGQAAGPVLTYGEHPDADLRVLVEDDHARIRHDGEDICRLRLAVPGRHNLHNAAAALAVCMVEGVDLARAARGIADFSGAARRFQILGEVDGITVVDDYAHHPTELRATLEAARSRHPERILVVVQPHRYSRTQRFGEALGQAAAAADVVVATEVYAASEAPVPGVTGEIVADAAKKAGARVVWQPHLGAVVDELQSLVRAGDLVLITGAGDVTQVGPALLSRLRGGQ